jgi:hypothetical protein
MQPKATQLHMAEHAKELFKVIVFVALCNPTVTQLHLSEHAKELFKATPQSRVRAVTRR